jgi:hypothetical protein
VPCPISLSPYRNRPAPPAASFMIELVLVLATPAQLESLIRCFT